MAEPVVLRLVVNAEHKTAVVKIEVEVDQGREVEALQALDVGAREVLFRLGLLRRPDDESERN